MSNICDEIVRYVGCEIKEMVEETKFGLWVHCVKQVTVR